MATKTQERNVFIAAVKDGTHGAHLISYREIVNSETGVKNIVLGFDDNSEVVMPGSWTIRESEFPYGLYEGQPLAAYWEDGRFHLYEVEL